MTIDINDTEVVGSGAFTTMLSAGPAYMIGGAGDLLLQGSVSIQDTTNNDALIGIQSVAFWGALTLDIISGGSLNVSTSSATSTDAKGFYSGGTAFATFINDGTFALTSAYSATGVELDYGGAFTNDGSYSVSGSGSTIVTGFYARAATTITNAFGASITVSGAGATYGVDVSGFGGSAVTNDGTINVTSSGDRATGIRIYNNAGMVSIVVNHGTIIADDAVDSAYAAGRIAMTNTGAITGDVDLSVADGNFLANTGAIQGWVTFWGDTGVQTYDGRGGTLTGGGIGFAYGSHSSGIAYAYLGNDGEVVDGGSAKLIVYGGSGNDTIVGGWGDDFLAGGGGADSLRGGAGADTFALRVPSGSVTITDFDHTQGDKIDLSALGRYSFSDILGHATGTTNTVITLGALTITLNSVAPGSLQASDFVFGPIAVLQTDNFAIDPSVAVNATSGSLVDFTSAGGSLTNKGAVSLTTVSTSSNTGVGSSFGNNMAAVFENDGSFSISAPGAVGIGNAVMLHNTGTFSVTDPVGLGNLALEGATGSVINSGSMTIVSHMGTAYGVHGSNLGDLFQNRLGGTVSVTAAQQAYGVELDHGQDFENAGDITVSASTMAEAVNYTANIGSNALINTGTITATGATSIGIAVTNVYGLGAISLTNSGIITAATAIQFFGALGVDITNTGTINGAVSLANGANIIDSHAGAINGVITLGLGPSTVSLGGEDNTVVLGAGNQSVDGGGGANTVSFAAATAGVTVNLALQGSAQNTGLWTYTLTHIQNVVGSSYNDRLTAGIGTGVLTGGGGADTFVISAGSGAVTVTDFSHAQGDKIDLSARTELKSVADILTHAVQSGSNAVIVEGAGSITLDGVSVTSLRVSDFTLGNPQIPTTTQNTFDGGSTSAVAFLNTTTGDLGYMTANPSGGQTWHPLGPTSTAYSVVAKGDFNGDGLADIAFRSKSTGEWGYMSANPAGGEIWHDAGPTSLAYTAMGEGDFGGDGQIGIAFRSNATGAWGYMTTNSSGGETWHDIGPTSLSYDVVAIGDFDGGGRDEIAFRNNGTGDFGYMSATASGHEVWHAIGATGTTYAAVGFGDFNGDGVLDVAFREKTTGDWGFMTINPGGGETWHGVGPTSTAYGVIGAADYNGDGLTDLAFRDSAGDWGFMSVDGSGQEVWHGVGATSMAYTPV